jgi:alkaline phosphatase
MMVSDGFGPASETYGRSFWQYQQNDTKGINLTQLDQILVGASRTRSSDSLVTDSAAGATAFSCAKKSYNAAIGGKCYAYCFRNSSKTKLFTNLTLFIVDPHGAPCGTVLEAAKHLGMFTGLVVTSRVTHATPAAFSAHVVHRDMEADIAVQQMGDYPLGRQVDLMLGGGRCFFLPNTTEGSCRPDGRDLVKESAKYDWHVLQDKPSYEQLLNQSNQILPLPVMGLFHNSHMNFEIDRKEDVEPALHEMAAVALRSLQTHAKDENQGFFLMIEGSRIDMGAHNNDPVAHVHEILEYHKTIQVVREFVAQNPDTVMISTSDHETGGFTLGLQPDPNTYPDYLWRPEVIDRAKTSTEILTSDLLAHHALNLGQKATERYIRKEILGYGLGITDASDDEVAFLSNPDALSNDVLRFLGHAISRRANLGWTTMGHTGVDVNLYAETAPVVDKSVLDGLRGNHENTDIGDYISWYLGLDLESITTRLAR